MGGRMAESKWDVASATAALERNGAKVSDRVIRISSPGLKLLSAIDYLVNRQKFIFIKTNKQSEV
jgi:hypothetical protein